MSTDDTAQQGDDHRHGTRPPFPAGNAVNLVSGHRAVRVYGRMAEQLAAGLLEDRPDLARFPESIAAWSTVEAQAALLRRHLEKVGTIDPATDEPRGSLLNWLRHFENLAAKHRATLGLDPRSEAELARERATAATLGVNLEALAQQGRAALNGSEQDGRPALHDDLAGHVLAQVTASAPRYNSRYEDDPEFKSEDN